MTIEALQRRLRCHKCGRHAATVDVYSMARD
jgi:ribosomal protein S14